MSLQTKILNNERISPQEAIELYSLPLAELGQLADLRRQHHLANAYDGQGNNIVTYIIDRNINYTNVCNVGCKFCAFYRTKKDDDHYVLSYEELDRKIEELVALGGTQILLQGGHHPDLQIDFYIDLLRHVREKFPQVNVHGFSPPEFQHFVKTFRLPLKEILEQFKQAGLGSIPGGGAEILVDRVRQQIAALKCSTDQWLEVMETAHQLGLRSSATMMFGHVETIADRIEHLTRLRDLQDRTHGFTAFICWTFQPENTILKIAQKTTSHEYLRTQAIARIFLDNFQNIQASWVTQGHQIGQLALKFGANDFGGLMMEENVVSQAGATFRMTLDDIHRLIHAAGYTPRQRSTWYQLMN